MIIIKKYLGYFSINKMATQKVLFWVFWSHLQDLESFFRILHQGCNHFLTWWLTCVKNWWRAPSLLDTHLISPSLGFSTKIQRTRPLQERLPKWISIFITIHGLETRKHRAIPSEANFNIYYFLFSFYYFVFLFNSFLFFRDHGLVTRPHRAVAKGGYF